MVEYWRREKRGEKAENKSQLLLRNEFHRSFKSEDPIIVTVLGKGRYLQLLSIHEAKSKLKCIPLSIYSFMSFYETLNCFLQYFLDYVYQKYINMSNVCI